MKKGNYIAKFIAKGCGLLSVLLVLAASAWAQQEPVSTMYMNAPQTINPAYSGMDPVVSVTSVHRSQWVKFDGNLNTSSLSFILPVDSMRIGAGVDFVFDHSRPVTKSSLFANYSYRFHVTHTSQISLGLKAGAVFMQTRLTDLDRYHEDDAYILEYGDFDRLMPNFGVGLYYFTDDFHVGFSVPKIIQNKYHADMDGYDPLSREERHFFLQTAYRYEPFGNLALKPSATVIMVEGAPVTADLRLGVELLETFTVGATYRISDAVGAYAHLNMADRLQLGFAFDYTTSELRRHQKGTFEFMLRYNFIRKAEIEDGE